VAITQKQANALERSLNDGASRGAWRVAAGMRFSEPTIGRVIGDLAADGVEEIIGLIISPQYSPILMSGYAQQVEEAAVAAGVRFHMVGAWHRDTVFIRSLARRIHEGLAEMPGDAGQSAPVLLTAHSLPQRVYEREPDYVDQLKETARLVAEAVGLPDDRWHFAYQSAGHTPEEWLKPDMLDVLPILAEQGHRHVLLCPVQFVADHLETLYDIDIGGKEQADESGFEYFARVPAPNDAADFIEALGHVVRSAAKVRAA
jgi:ferrochelatase